MSEEKKSSLSAEDKKELQETITDAIAKGMKKYGGKGGHHPVRNTIVILAVIVLAVAAMHFYDDSRQNLSTLEPVENHDLTLENHGIFGYKAVDFQDAILGQARREQQLIVDEQEVSVSTTIIDAGLFKWGIFSKSQAETIYGTGEYTVDLAELTADDITLGEDDYTVEIHVPYPELHTVTFNPEKTVIGDTNRGWLAFGTIKMSEEERKAFETDSIQKLTDRLNEQDCFDRAVKYARLSIQDIYQPIVSKISPAYKVEIIVDDKPAEISASAVSSTAAAD